MNTQSSQSKPHIAIVTWGCSARVLKQSYVLRKRGYHVTLITNHVPPDASSIFGDSDIITFASFIDTAHGITDKRRIKNVLKSYGSPRSLRSVLKKLPKADIYHVHNEPSGLVSAVRRIFPAARIIFDVHDLNYMRNGIKRKDEQRAFKDADGVMWVAEIYGKISGEAYNYKGPSTTVLSSVPQDWYQEPRPGKGIVYQGGALSPEQVERAAISWNTDFSYRDYSKIIERFSRTGNNIVMYIKRNKISEHYYHSIGAQVRESLPYLALLRELSGFEWGLTLFNTDTDNMRYAMPNKIFDYIAAGIPIIGTNGTPSGDFIVHHGIGITMNENDPPKLPDSTPYRKRIIEVRDSLSMDREADKMETLYNEILTSTR